MRALAVLIMSLCGWWSTAAAWVPDVEADFAVKFGDNVIPYRLFGVYVMPGETVPLSIVLSEVGREVSLEATAGTVERTDAQAWRWTAPAQPGVAHLRLQAPGSDKGIVLNAFVKTPFDHERERINGYPIGHYPSQPLHGDPVYERPQGFVEVTPKNRALRVAPNFTLGQFLCKQDGGPPHYLVLREALLLKLEVILAKVQALGIEAKTLHVMSGFRTPRYNRQIKNSTEYSRHIYGGAVDILVDANGDRVMDDLDGNGRINVGDARKLAAIAHEKVDEPWYQPFVGGLGVYGPPSHNSAFVHVDVRGYEARW